LNGDDPQDKEFSKNEKSADSFNFLGIGVMGMRGSEA
jgi:hypothetical protein